MGWSPDTFFSYDLEPEKEEQSIYHPLFLRKQSNLKLNLIQNCMFHASIPVYICIFMDYTRDKRILSNSRGRVILCAVNKKGEVERGDADEEEEEE